MKTTDRVTYERTKIDYTTGEITSQEFIHRYGAEPAYVKLYLDCLCDLKGLSKSLNPILIELLKHMSYAGKDEEFGGQLIYLNSVLKRNICKVVKRSMIRLDQALGDFCKAQILKRVARGTYQVNPYLFGKGDWKDIKNIRATIDFGARTIENLEIIKETDSEEYKNMPF